MASIIQNKKEGKIDNKINRVYTYSVHYRKEARDYINDLDFIFD